MTRRFWCSTRRPSTSNAMSAIRSSPPPAAWPFMSYRSTRSPLQSSSSLSLSLSFFLSLRPFGKFTFLYFPIFIHKSLFPPMYLIEFIIILCEIWLVILQEYGNFFFFFRLIWLIVMDFLYAMSINVRKLRKETIKGYNFFNGVNVKLVYWFCKNSVICVQWLVGRGRSS